MASFTGTTDSSTSTTGAVKIAGGLGVAKTIRSGENIIATGHITSIGAGEHYLEARNSTCGCILRTVVNEDGKVQGLWSNGYVNSSDAFVSEGKWLLYRNLSGGLTLPGIGLENNVSSYGGFCCDAVKGSYAGIYIGTAAGGLNIMA